MNYECEADYNAAMAGQGEAEAMAEQERQYHEYLDGLIENKEYDLYGVEICLDFLNSHRFKNSGLTALQYLCDQRNRIQGRKMPEPNNDSIELPF